MSLRMRILHAIARMLPEEEAEDPSFVYPAAMSLTKLMDCYAVMECRHWGHLVAFLRFADRYRLSEEDWNVLYTEIVNNRHTIVPALLPLMCMYLYFYVMSWIKKKK